MSMDRRRVLTMASIAALAGVKGWALVRVDAPSASPGKLYRSVDPKVLLEATRALLKKDEIGTLITVDGEGQPRARSVLVSPPDDNFSLWIGTRRGSRKLAQIAAHPAATLHFSDDANSAYLSVMGDAHEVADAAVREMKNPYSGEMRRHFFPRYPTDFALIRFEPKWLEIMTSTLGGNPENWQPQGLSL